MADPDIRRSDYTEPDDAGQHERESSPPPGDPRDAQEPQEPRSTLVGAGREHPEDREAAPRPIRTPPRRGHGRRHRGVVDELREVWDRMRGRH